MAQALFPDNTYGVDSGGDPLVIPKLTFEEFKVRIDNYIFKKMLCFLEGALDFRGVYGLAVLYVQDYLLTLSRNKPKSDFYLYI